MIFGLSTDLVSEVTIDEVDYYVSFRPPNGPEACVWALQDDWRSLFPGALPEDQRDFWMELVSDPSTSVGFSALRPVAFDLASQLYGVPWWTAHRLTEAAFQSRIAYEAWTILQGFDPARESARRIISSIVAWQSEQWSDESEAQSWQQRMFMPPPGVRK